MLSISHRRGGHYALLLAAALPLFFWNLGGATLWDLDEGRNFTCSREMLLSDNWVIPTFNNELRDHKPVLLYWLQMFGFMMGGINETMGRLPSAVAALLTLLVAYELGRRMFSKSTGLYAGMIAATSPMLIAAARFANPDALLNLFTALTMLIFWINMQRPNVWLFAAAGASTGLAVLAKGPVGLVLPTAVVGLFVLWDKRWSAILDRRILWTILTFLAVALPWYLLVTGFTHAQFLRGFIMSHNVDRFWNTMENHRGNILYYPLVMLVGTMPWSLFAVPAAWAALWSCVRLLPSPPAGNDSAPREIEMAGGEGPGVRGATLIGKVSQTILRWRLKFDPAADGAGRGGTTAYRLLASWILVYLVFFSMSATKLPNYILPIVVPWTLLTARLLDRWRKDTFTISARSLTSSAIGLALIGVLISTGLLIAGGVGELALMRGRFLPMLVPFAPFGLVFVATAAILIWAIRHDRRQTFVNSIFVGALVMLAPLAAWATAALNDAKACATLARTTPAGRQDVDQRIVAMKMGHLPSLNFYLRRDLFYVETSGEMAFHLMNPTPTYALLPEAAFETFQNDHPNLAHEVARHYDFYRGGNVVLVANQ